MKQEVFQLKYAKKLMNKMLITYLEVKLGTAEFDDEKGMEEFNEKADYFLEVLVEKNEDEIEALIE